ncbi:MAG: hypothetical protein ABIR35_04725 [Polaromonas sp.]
MSTQYMSSEERLLIPEPMVLSNASSEHGSAVSWGAILVGAAGAAALSLILLILGTGLGLSSVSPWAQTGVTAATLGASAIVWLAFTQLAASSVGGYLAGRLSKKWVGVHTDESYFRDTAHGFLAWAVATLATAALLGSVIGSIVNTGVQAGTAAGGGVATAGIAAASGAASVAGSATISGQGGGQGAGYFVDSLFRRNLSGSAASSPTDSTGATVNTPGSSSASSNAEVSRIFANSMSSDAAMPPEDVRYLGQLVTQRTGLSQPDAEKRVTETYSRMQAKVRDAEVKAKAAADQARKASAYTALWLFVSLLLGAFVASLTATFGGRRRDL